jgi:hypothetical protein
MSNTNNTSKASKTNEPSEAKSLSTEKEKWLLAFPGVNVAANPAQAASPTSEGKQPTAPVLDPDAAFLSDMAQRKDVLAQVSKQMQEIVPDLKGAFSFEITTRDGETLPALAESGTSLNEADRTEWEGKIPEKNRKKIEEAMPRIEKIAAVMSAQKSVATKKALFTRDEVADAVWTPLVRLRIIPETVVPHDYSQVAIMIEKTNEQYKKQVEQLKKTGKLTPPTNTIKVVTAVSKEMIKMVTDGLKIAGPEGLDYLSGGAIKDMENIVTVTKAVVNEIEKIDGLPPETSMTNVVAAITQAILEIGAASVKVALTEDIAKSDKKALTDIKNISSVASVVTGETATVIDSFSSESKIKIVEAITQALLKTGAAAAKVSGPNDFKVLDEKEAALLTDVCEAASIVVPEVDKLVENIIDAKWKEIFSTSFPLVANLLGSKLTEGLIRKKYSKKTEKKETGKKEADATTEMIVKCVQKSCTAVKLAGKTFDAAYSDKGLGDALTEMLGSALSAGIGCAYGEKLGKKIKAECPRCILNKKEEFEGEAYIETIGKWVVLCCNTAVNSIADSKLEVNAGALAKKFEELQNEKKIQMREQTNIFLNAADASSIDKLIAKIEKDRKVFDTAMKISKGGIDIAAKLFAPYGMYSLALEFMQSCEESLIRVTEIRKWLAAQESFAKAQSPLVSSAYNQVKNLGAQITKHAVDATLKAVQLVGNVMQFAVGTPIAAIGKAVEGAAKVAAIGVDASFSVYNTVQLERGWAATEAAFRDPKNRRLALQARAKNPTLAKYSIAWGALEKKDPLARSLMKKIGLTEASLERTDTDVHKVVKYLETLYNEDSKLYRECASAFDGIPASPELTPESWQQVINACKNTKEFLVTPSPESVPQIKAALIALDSVPRDRDATEWVAFHKRLGEKASGRFNVFALDTAAERRPKTIVKVYKEIVAELKKMEKISERVALLTTQLGKFLGKLATIKVENKNKETPHSDSEVDAAKKNLGKYFSALSTEAKGIAELFDDRAAEIKSTIRKVAAKVKVLSEKRNPNPTNKT